MLPLCNGGVPVPDVLVGLGKLLVARKTKTGNTNTCLFKSTIQCASTFTDVSMLELESACVLSAEVQGQRLYQRTLLHLSVSLLHLLDCVFPLVDDLLCLQVGLLQVFCSFIQGNLLGRQKKNVFS